MIRPLRFAVVALASLALSAHAATPIVPKVLTEDFRGPAFLENLTCGMLKIGQKLTVDPMTIPPGKTFNITAAETLPSTEAQRQVMVWKRLYECTVDALAAIDVALPQLTGTAYTTARANLVAAREGAKWPGNPGWEAFAMQKYGQGVRDVLYNTTSPQLYVLLDASYPWGYPEHSIQLMKSILAQFTAAHLPSPLSADLTEFVTRTSNMAGHPTDTSVFISNENVYFDAPLTDPEKIAQLELVESYHAAAGAALVCAYRYGEGDCAGVPAAQRVACIKQAGLNHGCPDGSALHDEEHHAEIENATTYGLPIIASTTRGLHPSLTFADVCVSVQRAHRAYTAWMELVRDNGHTLAGFHASWMASLGHAQIHVERSLGLKMPPLIAADVADPLNPAVNVYQSGFRIPFEIRQYVYAAVPGVVNGECVGEEP